MITGTYVLTDQIDNGFADIFETSFKGTAVQVEPKTIVRQHGGRRATDAEHDPSPEVLAVPGVDKAAGIYETVGAAIVDGETVKTGGAPTLLTTNTGKPFTQATLVAGAELQGRNEVAIIKSFADKAGLKPGDTFAVVAPAGLQQVKVAGVFEWGDVRLHGRHHRHRRPPAGRAALGRRARQAQRHLRLRRPRRHAREARRASSRSPCRPASASRPASRPPPTRPPRRPTRSARSSRRCSWRSPASPSSSARSSSSTPSASPSRSGAASSRCCARSAPAAARCCVGGRRGAHARRAGLGARHRRRPRRRLGHQPAVQGPRRRHPDGGHRARAADDPHRRARRRGRDPALRARPGPARHARAAGGGDAGGLDAAADPLRQVQHRRSPCSSRPPAPARSPTASSATARPPAVCSSWAWARSCSSSPSRCWPSSSCGR